MGAGFGAAQIRVLQVVGFQIPVPITRVYLPFDLPQPKITAYAIVYFVTSESK
jgi:hypothetical protein